MNCKKCGSPLVPGAAMCSACGTAVMNNEFSTPPNGVQPSMGQPMSIQAPMGQPPMGQPMPGQQPMGQPPMGQPMSGPVPMGQPPMGQPMSGPVPMGQPPMGQPMPEPVPMGQQTASVGTDKKKKSKTGLIIIILLAIAAIAIGGVFIDSCVKDQNETKKSENKKDKEKDEETTPSDVLEKSVSIKSEVKLADGGLLFVVSNTSSKTIAFSLEVEFYDANELILGSSVDNTTLAPKSDGYLYFNEYAVKEGYTKYLTNMTVVDYTDVQKVVNISETEFVKNETEDELILQYKNTGTETLDYVGAIVLFYSNNQIVAYDDATKFDVQAGSNANLSFYINLIKEESAYDRYEIHGYSAKNIYSD